MYIEYEVYARYGETDVVTCATLDEAIKVAKKWSLESEDTEICIEKVTREPRIMSYKGGKEIS